MTTSATGNWHDVLAKTEVVVIVTSDGGQPHTVATWGEYVRALSEPGSDTLLIPAGRYQQTEANLRRHKRVQVLIGSRQVAGTYGPGQGYLLQGEGELQAEGEQAARAKAKFPWARGALVLRIHSAQAQL